eukprot:CAMPEP_0118983232 /NCGR_PEP_ID=MMETSP1173-20130426/34837_1 /TAXON_ID=1034831 /ORGANISM="Rhizochromulina marina cf, Strain CCMP1243" /LENGTH=63 /DNA_ID=CAMNT_0006933789 /DNA_START=109 /DNA_END=297 /DNA_ORIENTATION=+
MPWEKQQSQFLDLGFQCPRAASARLSFLADFGDPSGSIVVGPAPSELEMGGARVSGMDCTAAG